MRATPGFQSTMLGVALGVLPLLAGCTSDGSGGGGWLGLQEDEPEVPDAGDHESDGGHVHDYWDDKLVKTLLAGPVPVMVFHNHLFDEPAREQHTHGCTEQLLSDSQGGSVKFSLNPPQTVIPGTASLEATFTWSSPAITGLRFLYRAANGHEYRDAGLAQSGKTLTIPVTPFMADAGHATRSHWAFFLCADSDAAASVAQGDVQATIVARRAPELAPDPPHPDPWKNRTSWEIGNLAWNGVALTALNKGDAWLHVPLPAGSLVPEEADTVWVNVTFRSNGATSGLDPGTVMLYYQDSTVADWVYKRADPPPDAGGSLRFRVAVEENMWDGIYADASNWDFWLRIASETYATTPLAFGTWSAPHRFEGDVSATVTVVRGPAPGT